MNDGDIKTTIGDDETPSPAAASGNIRVVVRIRPLSSTEKGKGCKETIDSMNLLEGKNSIDKNKFRIGPETLQIATLGGNGDELKRCFQLDAVFDTQSTQNEVYVGSGAKQSVCEEILKGYNCTILAYGQTGSGKTFSMGTASASASKDIHEHDGIIPRACHDLFRSVQEKCDGNAKVHLSYLEIYNEELRDLLVDDQPNKSNNSNKQQQSPPALKIRETVSGEVYVAGLQLREVTSPEDVGEIMEVASKRRIVAATAMNATSSRSHAICVLNVEGVIVDDKNKKNYNNTNNANNDVVDNNDDNNNVTVGANRFSSKLTLVDLAGSERMKRTGAEGNRAREGININKSLLTLGQVVSALAAQAKKKPPFRESKLTRLLQDSLGGNSRTIMVACVSPADYNVEESSNTLRYAASARSIKNKAARNFARIITQEEAEKLFKENQLLKQKVAMLEESVAKFAGTTTTKSTTSKKRFMPSATSITAPTLPLSVSSSVVSSSAEEEADNDHHEHDKANYPCEISISSNNRTNKIKVSEKGNLVEEGLRQGASNNNKVFELHSEIEKLRKELSENDEENTKLRKDFLNAQHEAACAQRTTERKSRIIEELLSHPKKRAMLDIIRKDEAWVLFSGNLLEKEKVELDALHNDFTVVANEATAAAEAAADAIFSNVGTRDNISCSDSEISESRRTTSTNNNSRSTRGAHKALSDSTAPNTSWWGSMRGNSQRPAAKTQSNRNNFISELPDFQDQLVDTDPLFGSALYDNPPAPISRLASTTTTKDISVSIRSIRSQRPKINSYSKTENSSKRQGGKQSSWWGSMANVMSSGKSTGKSASNLDQDFMDPTLKEGENQHQSLLQTSIRAVEKKFQQMEYRNNIESMALAEIGVSIIAERKRLFKTIDEE